MADLLFRILFLVVGLIAGYLFCTLGITRNKELNKLIKAVQKRQMFAILETDTASYFRPIIAMYKNLAITPEKEVIIIPKGATKPIMNLNGVQVIHADLYKGIGMSKDMRAFIVRKEADGWKPEDVAKFFQEIEETPADILKKYYKDVDEKGEIPVGTVSEDGVEKKVTIPANDVEKSKYKTFLALPSLVRDFVYSGINRVSIAAMIREMVYQRELDKVGQKNWIAIGITIFLILLGIGIAARWILTSSGGTGINTMIPNIGPVKVNP